MQTEFKKGDTVYWGTLKETLEEAKNKAWENYEYEHGHLYSRKFFDAFELGAKWQQEQDKNKFSEEEVIAIVEKSRITGLTAEYLLLSEQFKKE